MGKVVLVDTTIRDGQQSVSATRMTTEQALRVLPLMVESGFKMFELWGGATLDAAMRYLGEDPWERLEKFKEVVGDRAKIRALLRGQNLFAYMPFPDDLVICFVKEAVRTGVDVMRIFDALNDWRNLQTALMSSKTYGAKVEAAVSYTVSPVHTTEYFVDFFRTMEDECADLVAIKDMAGLLEPYEAVKLIRRTKQEVSLPLTLHSHCTTGLAILNAVIGLKEKVDYLDVGFFPFAGQTAHPPVELVRIFAEEMGVDLELDFSLFPKISEELWKIYDELKEYEPYYGKVKPLPHDKDEYPMEEISRIINLVYIGDEESLKRAREVTFQLCRELSIVEPDLRILEAQVPGGMLTNLINQLKAIGQLDKLDEILKEIPRVRADAGYPPLVTPTSQIIGSQAAFNVMTGERYKTVSEEFKMLIRGDFGRTPAPISEEFAEKILGSNYVRKKARPAAYLRPALEDVKLPEYVRTKREMLLYLMLPQSAEVFLKKKYGAG